MFPIFSLLRVQQWYKNLVVFLVIFFSGNALSSGYAWLNLFFAFVCLCLLSSTNYIINDIVDREKDKLDKFKAKRPIASGKVSITLASIIALVFLVISLGFGFYLNLYFGISLALLFVLTQIYSFWLKNKVFFDIILIAINFMIRAIAGAFILQVYISSWFVTGIFFVAMFFVIGKRYGESKDGITKNRKVLEFYTPELMQIFLLVFLSILVLFYSMYIILNHSGYWFIATIPVFILLLLRYFSLIIRESNFARHAEKLFSRKDLVLGFLLWLTLFLFAMFKNKLF